MNDPIEPSIMEESQKNLSKKSWHEPRDFFRWFLLLAGITFLITAVAGLFLKISFKEALTISAVTFAFSLPIIAAVLLVRSAFSGLKLKGILFGVMLAVIAYLEVIAAIIFFALVNEGKYAIAGMVLVAIALMALLVIRWLLQRGLLKKFLIGGACVLGVIALLWFEENWRGIRDWKNYKAELIAQGEKLDWKDYSPALVPDDQNFVRTPFLQAIGIRNKMNTNVWNRFSSATFASEGLKGTNGYADLKACQTFLRKKNSYDLPPLPQEPAADVLAAFKNVEPIMEELRQASLRPYSQFIVSPPEIKRWDILIPNFVACRTIAQAFNVHASAELALGNADAAFNDFYTMHQLVAGLENSDPTLVSTMVGVAITGLNLNTFAEGWEKGLWSDTQLEKFQKLFGSMNLLKNLDSSLRGGERNAMISMLDPMFSTQPMGKIFNNASPLTLMPRGWLSQNLLVYTRAMQEWNPLVDVRQQKVFPTKADKLGPYYESLFEHRSPFNMLAAIGIPNFTKAVNKVAQTQTALNQAALVCALERFRHAQGEYPETLDLLKPRLIEQIPHDIIGGSPLKYSRTDDKKIRLYSIGWNEKDDGGMIGKNNSDGDWVWRYQIKAK